MYPTKQEPEQEKEAGKTRTRTQCPVLTIDSHNLPMPLRALQLQTLSVGARLIQVPILVPYMCLYGTRIQCVEIISNMHVRGIHS